MGRKFSQEENELYKRVDEVLHYRWDPIGIAGWVNSRDEYHSYLPKVFDLLIRNSSKKEIEEYLIDIANNEMSVSYPLQKTEEVADLLLERKVKILG